MGSGLEWAALASVVGGTLLQQQAADDAANQQRKILSQAAEEESRLGAKKADTINKFAETTFNPTTRSQNYENAATKNESILKDALLSAGGGENGEVYQGTQGDVSSDYLRGKATATASAADDILKRTRLLARSNALGNMFDNESIAGANMASDVMGINSEGRINAGVTTSKLKGVNTSGSMLGGLLVGAAPAIGGALSAKDLAPSASYGGILGMGR